MRARRPHHRRGPGHGADVLPEIAVDGGGDVKTDIPEAALQDFVDLAFKAKKAPVRSVVFDQTVINPAYPDYAKMRSIVQETLSGEVDAHERPARRTDSVAPSEPQPQRPRPP